MRSLQLSATINETNPPCFDGCRRRQPRTTAPKYKKLRFSPQNLKLPQLFSRFLYVTDYSFPLNSCLLNLFRQLKIFAFLCPFKNQLHSEMNQSTSLKTICEKWLSKKTRTERQEENNKADDKKNLRKRFLPDDPSSYLQTLSLGIMNCFQVTVCVSNVM